MRKLNLSEQDWLKLRDFNKIIAKQIQSRLPSDWYLTIEDIEGAVYDTFIKLLNNYKEGAMSPTSYCWQFGEKWTYQTLIAEYKKLKNEVNIDELYSDDKDDELCRHKYGVGEVQALTVDQREQQMVKDEVKNIYEKANKLDKMIIDMVLEGKNITEVAKEVGISARQIYRRLQKYRQ